MLNINLNFRLQSKQKIFEFIVFSSIIYVLYYILSMMEKLSMCRLCLIKDVRLHSLVNTKLQEIYEFLSGNLLETKDTRPLHACYMCCARLHNCLQLRTACLHSEQLFSHLFENDSCEVTPSQYMSVLQRAPVMHMNVDSEGHWELNIQPSPTTDDWIEDLQDNVTDKGICNKEEELDYSIQHFKEEASDNSCVEDDSQNDISKSKSCISSVDLQDLCRKTVKIVLHRIDLNSFRKDAPVLKKPKLTALKEKEIEKKSGKVKVGIKETRNYKKILKTYKPAVESMVYCPSNEVENIFHKSHNEKTVDIENDLNNTSNFSKKLSNDNSTFNEQNQTYINEEPPKCIIDEKSFNFKSKLQNKTIEKPYKCDHCQKCFNQHCTLKIHLRTRTGEKPYKCDHCQKCFSLKENLKVHLRTHTGEKPYKCDHCQKCFNLHRNFKRHLHTHTGEKPYKCDHCQKCFNRHHNLKVHLRTHTGEKPYKCDHCQKCFNLHRNLKRHLRTHTGEKPYKCDHCQKCFNQHITLKRHLRTHTGEKPYQCGHCQKCFSLKGNLKVHLRTHMGEKPYHCQKVNLKTK